MDQDLGIPESPQSRVTLGIAIFQDIMTIVFIVLIPAIIGSAGLGGLSLALLKGIAFLLGIGILSKFGLPQMLDAVAKTRSNELFTVTVIGMCAAVALVSGLLGLSAALGAFAAGVVVSESIYSHRVLSDVLPFKDLFLTVFFVSVGLLLDVGIIMNNIGYIILMVALIILIKGVIAALAARASGLKMNTWILPAVALASTGEFSIVLFNKIFEEPVISDLWEQIILAATAITMSLLPSMMKWGFAYSKKVRKHKSKKDHVIICGYGPVGQNLHRNLEQVGISVVILETNAETVKSLLSRGVKALFADASDHESLELANLSTARGLAITFPNIDLIPSLAKYALSKNSSILLYARSKFLANVEALEEAGVHHVMLDEEQSGRAMIRSVMQSYARDIEESWRV